MGQARQRRQWETVPLEVVLTASQEAELRKLYEAVNRWRTSQVPALPALTWRQFKQICVLEGAGAVAADLERGKESKLIVEPAEAVRLAQAQARALLVRGRPPLV